MFALSEGDLVLRILGCGDGPASFNAEATRRGCRVISCDPIYQFKPAEIQRRIDQACPQIMSKLRETRERYIWDTFGTIEELGETRMAAMSRFLADFETGRTDGRYVPAALPSLPFRTGEFDLALCSHFLFLYSAQVGENTHIASLRELCRVAHEVRVFPLVSLDGSLSPHLRQVRNALLSDGFDVTLQPAKYRFQRGAEEMLVVKQARKQASRK